MWNKLVPKPVSPFYFRECTRGEPGNEASCTGQLLATYSLIALGAGWYHSHLDLSVEPEQVPSLLCRQDVRVVPRLLMGLLAASEERAIEPLGGACGGWGRGVADVEGLRPGSLHWGVASGGGVLRGGSGCTCTCTCILCILVNHTSGGVELTSTPGGSQAGRSGDWMLAGVAGGPRKTMASNIHNYMPNHDLIKIGTSHSCCSLCHSTHVHCSILCGSLGDWGCI